MGLLLVLVAREVGAVVLLCQAVPEGGAVVLLGQVIGVVVLLVGAVVLHAQAVLEGAVVVLFGLVALSAVLLEGLLVEEEVSLGLALIQVVLLEVALEAGAALLEGQHPLEPVAEVSGFVLVPPFVAVEEALQWQKPEGGQKGQTHPESDTWEASQAVVLQKD
jgi:hypothetical protein